jgi:hypothetical protein
MVILALVLALAAPAVPSPEFYFEQTTLTYRDGQATGPGVLSRVWFAGKKMRLEAGRSRPGPALILRLDKDLALRLDPQEKVAVSGPLDELRSRSQLDLSAAGDLMGGAGEGTARTRPIEGEKVIAGERCIGFRIRSTTGTMDVYVAPRSPVGVGSFAEFLEWSGANQSMGGIMAELRRLPGFPMETHSHVTILQHSQDTVSTVTVLRVGAVDPALFEPPADYQVISEPKQP